MPSPKRDTSSHSSSDDHSFDGPDEYEVEYDEERAVVAEPTSDVDCNKAVGLHQYDPFADEAFTAAYVQEMKIRGEDDQRLIRRFEGREATDAW